MPNIVSVSFSKFGEGEEENPRSGEYGLAWDRESGGESYAPDLSLARPS